MVTDVFKQINGGGHLRAVSAAYQAISTRKFSTGAQLCHLISYELLMM